MENPTNPFDADQREQQDRSRASVSDDKGSETVGGEGAPLGMSGGQREPGREFDTPVQTERTGGAVSTFETNTERTGIGGTIGGGLQGTAGGGTSQVDQMNPGPGGTGNPIE